MGSPRRGSGKSKSPGCVPLGPGRLLALPTSMGRRYNEPVMGPNDVF